MRVLLIDDDARLAELLEGYLTPQGVALVHAGGGQAGLAALQGGGFDAVFLDVMMPGLDGLAVLRKIRDAGHRVPVLMLTARGDEADRVVGLELGADDYITKPFSIREFRSRVRALPPTTPHASRRSARQVGAARPHAGGGAWPGPAAGRAGDRAGVNSLAQASARPVRRPRQTRPGRLARCEPARPG